jgi:vibriolysin
MWMEPSKRRTAIADLPQRPRRDSGVALALMGLLSACVPDRDCEVRSPAEPFDADDPAAYQRAEQSSREHLVARPHLLDGIDGIWTRDVVIDERGEAHVRVGQSVDGIRVFGAEAIVHIDATGGFAGFTDGFARYVHVDTRTALAAARAVELAVAAQSDAIQLTALPSAELAILRRGKDALVYRVQLDYVDNGQPSRPVVFVDAKSGAIVWSYDNLQTALDREVHDLDHTTTLPGPIARTETGAESGDTDVDTSFESLGWAYDCYANLFGRDSFDTAGAKLISSVHYGISYSNAHWTGTQMVFGDGNNVTTASYVAMDVTGHELTHAVIDYTSNLKYYGESGGMNEALADIFGAVCQWYRDNNGDTAGPTSETIWMVGEDTRLVEPASRYMDDPARDGKSLDFWTPTAGSVNVHQSSGIANLAFYLAANGGQHPRGKSTTVVSGIGIYDAARVFYRANTTYLTPSSNFSAARVATINAATDLFGADSSQAEQITNAWTAVGVMPPPDFVVIDTRTNLASSTQLAFSYPTNGATAMKFVISGGTGDADLFVRFGSPPTLAEFDCYQGESNETCELYPPQSGTYYLMIRAAQPYSGVTLTVSAANGGPWTETTCSDGVDDDSDGATDCADSDCGTSLACSWVVISSTDFESGLGPYTDGGNRAARVDNATVANSGRFSMQLRDDAGAASSFFTTTPMSLSTVTEIRIQYNALAQSMENGDKYLVEIQVDGGEYQVVAELRSGSEFTKDARHARDLQIPVSNATSVRVRFRCAASNNSDIVYIDDVVISAR